MSKHSPGPWRVGGDCRLEGDGGATHFVELTTGRGIWDAHNEPVVELRDWFELADLRLIAAAPDYGPRMEVDYASCAGYVLGLMARGDSAELLRVERLNPGLLSLTHTEDRDEWLRAVAMVVGEIVGDPDFDHRFWLVAASLQGLLLFPDLPRRPPPTVVTAARAALDLIQRFMRAGEKVAAVTIDSEEIIIAHEGLSILASVRTQLEDSLRDWPERAGRE